MTTQIEAIVQTLSTLDGTLYNDTLPGTFISDQPIAPSYSAIYGLSGNDTLSTNYSAAYGALASGQGDDDYLIHANKTAIVVETGYSPNDFLQIDEGLGAFHFTQTTDGNLIAHSSTSTLIIAGWADPSSKVETWSFAGTNYSFDAVHTAIINSAGFQIDVTMDAVLGTTTGDFVKGRIVSVLADEKTAEIAALDTMDKSNGAGSIFRFYNEANGQHFYTGTSAERDSVVQNYGQFTYEGAVFKSASSGSDIEDVFRFYNSSTGEHFYTASAEEKQFVMDHYHDYAFEGVAYTAHSGSSGTNTAALYRFYDENTHTHFYTTDMGEYNTVLQHYPSYHAEGIAYYVDHV